MLEGRSALVVGGGRVGQRKVELLLDAGADVTLVCPDCVDELGALACAGRIRHEPRRFDDRDAEAAAVVFACTDDKHVNRHVLDVAKAARVPCCCADGNWAEGDFVTPAILRAGDVMIAVSTSGKSCRQSRLIKDNLRKHLDSIESSDLLVLGTSHEFLAAEERAPFHLSAGEREAVGAMIRQVWGVHEFFILNTCNRIEIVAAVSKDAATCGILRRLMGFDRLRPGLYYMKHGFDAFSHLCLVTAGMDSQIPGEFHVVSQMKEAVDEAAAFGWAGSIIRELADAALHISKDIHQEVGPLMDVAEIEDVALRYLDSRLPEMPTRRVLVIGTGTVGQGLVAGLLKRGCACVWAYHRNAPVLSGEDARCVQAIQLGDVGAVLPDVDAVISAVDAKEPVVTVREHAGHLKPEGVVMVDLGMPRNIDPAFDRLGAHVRVADLDALKHWYRSATGTLDKILEACHAVLDEHRDIYERMRRSIQGDGAMPCRNQPTDNTDCTDDGTNS